MSLQLPNKQPHLGDVLSADILSPIKVLKCSVSLQSIVLVENPYPSGLHMQSASYEIKITPHHSMPKLPYSDFEDGPLAPFGAPVWKPFLNILGTPFM
jgi:hypothetical protein